MYSTVGRPRLLTDEQVDALMAWHRSRKTLRQWAEEFGVSVATLQSAIDRAGHYKQVSPEQRQAELAMQQTTRRRLRKAGFI